MNEQQRLNGLLEILLGQVGRAVWLAVRVDDKSISEVAAEQQLSIGRVKEILATADFAIDEAQLVSPQPARRPLKTAWEGFHHDPE